MFTGILLCSLGEFFLSNFFVVEFRARFIFQRHYVEFGGIVLSKNDMFKLVIAMLEDFHICTRYFDEDSWCYHYKHR